MRHGGSRQQGRNFVSELRRALAEGNFFVLDGATGTMLQAAGMPAGMAPERFCLEQPEVLKNVHAAYVGAGADMIITATFGGSRFKLPGDIEPLSFNRMMAELAVSVAREARRRVFVAGNVGPSGFFVRPLGDLEPVELVESFRAQIRGLVQGGVDCIFIETQFDLAEARAAVVAARMECDLPVLASMTFEQGMSLTGSCPEIFAQTMLNLGVDALGANCGAGPEQMRAVVERLLACARIPVLAEPNAGLPELVNGKTVFRLPPETFAEQTAAFAAAGVQLLGGCCGTTPEHIAALRRRVEGMRRHRPDTSITSGITLTTRTQLVRIGGEAPLAVIGERINPTGKKILSAQFQAGEFTQALVYADEQVHAGAHLLDVNVGAPMVKEEEVLPELVQRLTARHGIPLALDSSNAQAIARALTYCPGSPLVNSVSGEVGRMEELGPLCRDWGAPFILLPLRGKKLPVMATERIAILEDLLLQAESLGISRRLLLVDVLALSVSAKAEAGRQCLETIRWCVREGLPTVIGLSNVSFGLPARELINAAFLAMAAGAGVSSCIANPGSPHIREMADCADMLLHKDLHAARFIAGYAGWTPQSAGTGSAYGETKPAAAINLYEAILHGDKENVLLLLEEELAAGAVPFALVQEKMIPAITEVGARYERREYFLPQLIRSAETMQSAFVRLRPLLEQNRTSASRPVIVLATVEGDIHDIGKNIVALLLSNHGFEVVDAGKDVKAEDIVETAYRCKASIIGLSALMTTTMVRMEDTVRLLKERGLPMKVMVGGAVLTPAYAKSIGADGYAADAVEAVRLAGSLIVDV
jgi:5-methyltetrahydrofolate--homocysteine methyltransferase